MDLRHFSPSLACCVPEGDSSSDPDIAGQSNQAQNNAKWKKLEKIRNIDIYFIVNINMEVNQFNYCYGNCLK